MDLGNGDLKHFVRFRKVRHFVIENVICLASVPYLFRVCMAEGFYPVRIERLIGDFQRGKHVIGIGFWHGLLEVVRDGWVWCYGL